MPLHYLDEATSYLHAALRGWSSLGTSAPTVWHRPDSYTPTLVVAWPFGSADEPEGHPGLAHLLEHALFRGDAGRCQREDALLSEGGASNGFCGRDSSLFWSSGLPDSSHLVVENERLRYDGGTSIDWVDRQRAIIELEIVEKTCALPRVALADYARVVGNRLPVGDYAFYAVPVPHTKEHVVEQGLVKMRERIPLIVAEGLPVEAAVDLADHLLDDQAGVLDRNYIAEPDVSARRDSPKFEGLNATDGAEAATKRIHSWVIRKELGILELALLIQCLSLFNRLGMHPVSRLHVWGDLITGPASPPYFIISEWPDVDPPRQFNARGPFRNDDMKVAIAAAARQIANLAKTLQAPGGSLAFAHLWGRAGHSLTAPLVKSEADLLSSVVLVGDLVNQWQDELDGLTCV